MVWGLLLSEPGTDLRVEVALYTYSQRDVCPGSPKASPSGRAWEHCDWEAVPQNQQLSWGGVYLTQVLGHPHLKLFIFFYLSTNGKIIRVQITDLVRRGPKAGSTAQCQGKYTAVVLILLNVVCDP